MAEDFDVEAMLEAPFTEKVSSPHSSPNHKSSSTTNGHSSQQNKERDRRSTSRDRDRKTTRDDKKRRHSRSRSRERRSKRSRSRSRDRRKDERRRSSRSRSRDRRDRDKDRSTKDSKSSRDNRDRRRHSRSKSRSRSPYSSRSRRKERRYDKSKSRSRSPHTDSIEERDLRTVLCVQLAAAVRQRDLEEFFSSVGRVREVRLILDNKTRKHKGIAYIEFYDLGSVPLALALNGQKLCGRPIIIQPSQAEKNRAAAAAAAAQNFQKMTGPMRLYVGSLHFNITEDMLRSIFGPFGRIDRIEIMRDDASGRSKGFGFVTFSDADDARKALETLNGFEIAGRPMKVNHVTPRDEITTSYSATSILDSDETDRSGIELGTTGRLQLMAKLAEGTGIQLPKAAVTALQMGQLKIPTSVANQSAAVPVATQCFLLTNMFDLNTETGENWDEDIKNDVIDECRKHGGALHVLVDKTSVGNVYVKCPTISAAAACVSALHGRWFSGRLVTAAYVPLASYHALFPDSINASTPL